MGVQLLHNKFVLMSTTTISSPRLSLTDMPGPLVPNLGPYLDSCPDRVILYWDRALALCLRHPIRVPPQSASLIKPYVLLGSAIC